MSWAEWKPWSEMEIFSGDVDLEQERAPLCVGSQDAQAQGPQFGPHTGEHPGHVALFTSQSILLPANNIITSSVTWSRASFTQSDLLARINAILAMTSRSVNRNYISRPRRSKHYWPMVCQRLGWHAGSCGREGIPSRTCKRQTQGVCAAITNERP